MKSGIQVRKHSEIYLREVSSRNIAFDDIVIIVFPIDCFPLVEKGLFTPRDFGEIA